MKWELMFRIMGEVFCEGTDLIGLDPLKKHSFIRIARFLLSLCKPRAGYLVLCCHKIVPPDDLGLRLSPGNYISTNNLESQLKYLSRHGEYLGHDELLNRLKDKVQPGKIYFTITFDDGYENVLHYGLPILNRLEMGATIFLATAFLDDPFAVPYWDELEYFVRNYHGSFVVKYDGFSARYSLHSLKGKRAFLADSSKYILHNYDNREEVLNCLRKRVGGRVLRKNDFLSWDQLRDKKDTDIGFGSHTHTHSVMSALSESETLDDALACKQRIESELNCWVKSFAIPFGNSDSYSEKNLQSLVEQGFQGIFTGRPGYNHQFDITSIERVSVNAFDRKSALWGNARYYYLSSCFRKIIAPIRTTEC